MSKKVKLTKGLSLGTIDKAAVPVLKTDLAEEEQKTTIYINAKVLKAAKQFALDNDMTFKLYLGNLIKEDMERQGRL